MKALLYISIILVVIGLILMIAGTITVTYPREVFSVNGMHEVTGNKISNYFINFFGFAIFLFGVGGLLANYELKRGGMRKNG